AQLRGQCRHAGSASWVPPSANRSSQSVGVDGLRSVLRTSAQALRPIARIRVPLGNGKLLAALHRDAEVMAEAQVDGVVEVTARVVGSDIAEVTAEGGGVGGGTMVEGSWGV